MTTIILDPERIRMDADLEMRKAKARLDQIPDYAPNHTRMRTYLRFVTMGTALAIREHEDEGWPVPMMAFDIETMKMAAGSGNPIYQAWADIDGNTCDQVAPSLAGIMEFPGMMSLNRVPIYTAVNDQHKAINLYLIGDKDWFIGAVADMQQYRQNIARLNQKVATCEIILNELKEGGDDEEDRPESGPGPFEPERLYPW